MVVDYNIGASFNTIVDLINYFSTPEKPVSDKEFFEFWYKLDAAEKAYFMYAPLD